MLAATRPVAAAAAALMGATVIAAVPVLTPATPAVPRFHAPDVALTSSIFDILTFPAWQQAIANEVEFVAIRTAGLAEAGTGLVESLAQVPATLLTAAQQELSNRFARTSGDKWAGVAYDTWDTGCPILPGSAARKILRVIWGLSIASFKLIIAPRE